jgi:SepF-like predicted cell division protein (DUF552 family)
MLPAESKMAIIGYRRVSTIDQNLDRQDLGQVDKTFEEKLSGKSAADRPALQEMIEYVRDGDSVVVYSIDRLARDLRDLQDVIQTLNDSVREQHVPKLLKTAKYADQIVRTRNGYFASIIGPYEQSVAEELKVTTQFIPSDAYLSSGNGFLFSLSR